MTAVDPGGASAFDDGSGVDLARLRAVRRARCLTQMERAGVDVLILGREPNARYVSGARRLWTAGTRGFAPGCIVVRESDQVYLLSTWDDGIPPEVPHEHLIGTSWNPALYEARLASIPGLAAARTIGVDAMSARFAGILARVAPDAAIVDGDAVLQRARVVKTADELACIRTAIAVAEGALARTIDSLSPGTSEQAVVGRWLDAMTACGTTTSSVATCTVTPRHAERRFAAPPLRLVPTDRAIASGDLVALSVGALCAGYEGTVARTWPCRSGSDASGGPGGAHAKLFARWLSLWERVRGVLRPGAAGDDVVAAYLSTGEAPPPFPIAHGVGLGMEPPILGPQRAAAVLVEGMVLAVQGYVWEDGVGGCLVREVVAVTASGHEVLTRAAHPLALTSGR